MKGGNTKGLLVASFGTTHDDTREKTIDQIEKKLGENFPEYKLYSGWTSKIVSKKTGHATVSEALGSMQNDGIRDIVVVPTHLMMANEYEKLMDIIEEYKDKFESILVGKPILSDEKMILWTADFIAANYEKMECGNDEAYILAGHGTDNSENKVYGLLQERLEESGYKNILIGTFEAKPSIEDILAELKSREDIKKLHIAPFLIVAGTHANEDLWGDEEDSWRQIFLSKGYEVITHKEALGEFEEIHKMFVDRTRELINY